MPLFIIIIGIWKTNNAIPNNALMVVEKQNIYIYKKKLSKKIIKIIKKVTIVTTFIIQVKNTISKMIEKVYDH